MRSAVHFYVQKLFFNLPADLWIAMRLRVIVIAPCNKSIKESAKQYIKHISG